MEMKDVTGSSQVKQVGYDDKEHVLAVMFHSGATYHYKGVSADTHKKMMKAESIGKFLHLHVKGKHPHKLHSDGKAKS